MQTGTRYHLARVSCAVIALCGITALGCVDSAAPTSLSGDEWASAVAVGVTLRTEMRAFAKGGNGVHETHMSGTASLPVVQGFGPAIGVSASASSRKGPRLVSRHFRRDSVLHSLVFVLDSKGTASRIFAFENARIKAIVSAEYLAAGRGYVRKRAKTTVFENGVPVGQVERIASDFRPELSPALKASSAGNTAAVADAVLAFESDREIESACASEYTSYYIASAALALASTALVAAAPGCATAPGPYNPLCLGAGAAFTGFIAALDRWHTALDRLLLCIENEELKRAKEPGGGTEHEADSESGEGDGELPLRQAVEQFVREAIVAGRYWCTESGDYCIFY